MRGLDQRIGSLTSHSNAEAPDTGVVGASGNTLDALLFECIDETLTDLLGRLTKEAIYDYLERNCSLARNEIPGHLDDFFNLLEKTFGKGSKTIGKVIARKLYAKLEWEFEEIPNFGFVDYLERIRGRIARELLQRAKLGSSL